MAASRTESKITWPVKRPQTHHFIPLIGRSDAVLAVVMHLTSRRLALSPSQVPDARRLICEMLVLLDTVPP